MPPQFIYVMKDLRKVVPPSREILRGIWLSFYPGAKIGVLGANGAGKSSLLRIMAGIDHDFQGEAWAAKGTRVGHLAQEPKLDDAHDLWSLDNKVEIAMDALRLPPGDAGVTNLSGGERRRVALCRLLLEEPDMLLLDEPTNHLDAESVAWLERHLAEFKGCVVAVTHDRYFLDNVAGWILELDRGSGIPWQGNYSSWLEQKQKRLQMEERTESKRQRTLARELEWVRMAPRARQAKGKARLRQYEELLGQDTAKQLESVEIYIQPGPRLGDVVVEARDLRKAYGDKLLIDELNFTLPRGGIVGVIGPNGAGKTTLFRMITGQEKPDAGTLRLG